MNINQLRYFVAAAESRSFTRTAHQYYISQTAITQQIRALEESLDVELFDRKSRPISLTPAGKSFIFDAKSILERMDYAVHRVHEASVGYVGQLHIGYTKGFERSSLSDKLRSFHIKYPNVLLSCFRQDTDMLQAGLVKGEYDIIFTWDSAELYGMSDISSLPVEKSPLVAALYPGHPLALRDNLTRMDFKNETLIFMTLSSTGTSPEDMGFYRLYQNVGYHPNIIFRSNDVESVLMMVAAEQGISILPSYATQKLINAENIVFVPLKGDKETVTIIGAWKSGSVNPILKRFTEHIESLN